MNRRTLMALLAGTVLTPEGLWIPGAKKIFLPPTRELVGCSTVYFHPERPREWCQMKSYQGRMDSAWLSINYTHRFMGEPSPYLSLPLVRRISDIRLSKNDLAYLRARPMKPVAAQLYRLSDGRFEFETQRG